MYLCLLRHIIMMHLGNGDMENTQYPVTDNFLFGSVEQTKPAKMSIHQIF